MTTTTTVTIIWDDVEVCALHYNIASFAGDISLRRNDDTRLAALHHGLCSALHNLHRDLLCCMHNTRALTYIPNRLDDYSSLPNNTIVTPLVLSLCRLRARLLHLVSTYLARTTTTIISSLTRYLCLYGIPHSKFIVTQMTCAHTTPYSPDMITSLLRCKTYCQHGVLVLYEVCSL